MKFRKLSLETSFLVQTHLCEMDLESDPNSIDHENIATWPQPPGHKLSHHETPGTFVCVGDVRPQSEAVDGHYYLSDLEFPNVDIHHDQGACHQKQVNIGK